MNKKEAVNIEEINKANNTKEEIERPLLKPKTDIVFQSLFSKQNEYITKEFIGALLNKEIRSIVINEDKELYREYPEDKLGILDLEVEVNEEEKVDIEVQLINREDFVERLLFYACKMYTSQIKRGEKYNKAKRVVIIAIIDYDIEITKDIKEMITEWKIKRNEKTLTDKIEIDIIELRKAKEEYNKNKENKKAQWMMFMNNPESKEVKEIMEENEGIKEAVVTVRKMTKEEKMQRLEDLRQKEIMDRKSLYDTGLHQGIREEKIKIVKSMIKECASLEFISKVTELSIEEINKIKNDD